MQFSSPLLRGRLARRYKRFLADVALDGGETVTALCPNTGSMVGLAAPGTRIWLSDSKNPSRKYHYTWELAEHSLDGRQALVGINTGHPNRIVADAIGAGRIPELAGYPVLRREVPYGRSSRIDLLLSGAPAPLAYVEVKNVHMMRQAGLAEFPDCVTARGLKHLRELAAMATAGHRAVMLFLIQRADARAFAVACDIDPAYGASLAEARSAGVEVLAYRCRLSLKSITLAAPVPLVL